MSAITTFNDNSQNTLEPSSIYKHLLDSQLKATTRKNYRSNLRFFALYLSSGKVTKGAKVTLPESQVDSILGQFLALPNAQALLILDAYKKVLIDSGYAPNSLNLKIQVVKSLGTYAKRLGITSQDLELIKGVAGEVYRDTKGVAPEAIAKLLNNPDIGTPEGRRDYAILRLLWDLGLRRSELANVSWDDINLAEAYIRIHGKGKFSKDRLYLPPSSVAALQSLEDDTRALGSAVFVSYSPRGYSKLSDNMIYRIVKKHSQAAGIKPLSPHQIRHSGITSILDKTNGNLRRAQAYSRHANIQIVSIYDDRRQEEHKQAADLISSLV